ncbi:MAG TPA: methyltransferase domain-containing protein [Blastocatellia bacterium]|nr:methyltransferase domain-containing protein [Blastocatellia bacterium]
MMVKERDVQARFGRAADLYATSTVHARGADLGLAVQFARPQPEDVALDVSTGAGHMAMALAPHVARVVAIDLTPQMLAVARHLAAERGLRNVEFQEADARALPFGNGSFDLVTCRMAAHHYPRLEDAVREMARVLRPGGRLVVSDTVPPADEVADRFINAVEALRDPTHVRDWSVAEWRAAFSGAGLAIEACEEIELELEFEPWVERSGTPPELRQVLAVMLTQAPPRLRELFAVKANPLRFSLRRAVFLAIRT